MRFILLHRDGEVEQLDLQIRKVILGGWTGRNRDEVLSHIEELRKLGIPEPDRIPSFFPVPSNLLCSSSSIQVVGDRTNGEVEYVLFIEGKKPAYVTVGSDHTDREVERISVHLSKLLYPKVVAPVLWSYEDVKDHWDELKLSMEVDGSIAQESEVSSIIHPEKLLEVCDDCVIFSGSIKWKDGTLRFGKRYRISIEDPVLGRSISFSYEAIRIH
jgi:hypothetical protein